MLLSAIPMYAQVEHNYLVGPKSTSCDSMNIDDLSKVEIIDLLPKETFRFDQSIKVYASQGFQGAKYYSCDGKTGFMVMKFDGKYKLYKEVGKDFWDQMTATTDPTGLYYSKLSELKEIKR